MFDTYVTSDIDVLGHDFSEAALTFNLLERGPVEVRCSVASFADVALRELSTNLSIGCRGQAGAGIGLLQIWPAPPGKLSVDGRPVSAAQGLLAVGDDPIEVTAIGPTKSIFLTFELARLRGLLTPRAQQLLRGDASRRGVIGFDVERCRERLDFAGALLSDASRKPGSGTGEIMAAIADALEEAAQIRESVRSVPVGTSNVVPYAIDYMARHVGEPFVLKDISAATGLSQRSLIHHFSEVVGITPMAYYKLQRLNAVRRALRSADARTRRVLDVAAEFGFYHMGHFAADFRSLFGKLPSEVLGTAHYAARSHAITA
jgi:AraC-like DNA-binding protein